MGPTPEALPATPAVQIVVALTSLPAGKVLETADLKWQPWPGDALDASYIVQRDGQGEEKLEELAGTVVKRGILLGEPVTYAKVFKRDQAGFLSGMLAPGKRAISVPISVISAGSGFILPGDRVDVMLQLRVTEIAGPAGVTERAYSEVILEDVRVLAIDQLLNDVAEGEVAKIGSTATFEVTPKEAEILTVAKVMGTMSLVLRSLTPGDVEERDQPFTSDLEVSRSMSRSTMPDAFQVLAANRNVTPGTLLRARDIRWVVVPRQLVHSGFYVEGRATMNELWGFLVTAPTAAGVPFDTANLMKPFEPGFLAAVLRPGMRGVSIPISDVSGVSGYIAAGDRIDMLMTHTLTDDDPDAILAERRYTETILHNIRVVAVSTGVDTSSGRPVSGSTITLEVTPKQSEMLTLAPIIGDISVTLTRTADAPYTRSPTPFTTEIEISAAIIANLLGDEPDLAEIRARRRQQEAAERKRRQDESAEDALARAKTEALEARIAELQAMMEAQGEAQATEMQAKIKELQAQMVGKTVPTGDLGAPTAVTIYRSSKPTTIEFHQ